MGLLASLTYLFLFYFTISLIRFLEKKSCLRDCIQYVAESYVNFYQALNNLHIHT